MDTVTFNKHFGQYGEITDSVIMKDRFTGQPRGFGFITYADPSVVDKVIEDEHILNGKQVKAASLSCWFIYLFFLLCCSLNKPEVPSIVYTGCYTLLRCTLCRNLNTKCCGTQILEKFQWMVEISFIERLPTTYSLLGDVENCAIHITVKDELLHCLRCPVFSSYHEALNLRLSFFSFLKCFIN